jgi:DNA-directed RNA polymerase subunit RPC12/RpoP
VEPDDDAPETDDDRPPICPACGVTMGIVVEGEETSYLCLECGFTNT